MNLNRRDQRESLPELPPSEISFCVAIIPTAPLKEQVVSASVAVSKLYDNDKLIDDKPFPAHISLYLGGTKQAYISELSKELRRVTAPFLECQITARQLYKNSGGFIAVQCDVSDELATLA